MRIVLGLMLALALAGCSGRKALQAFATNVRDGSNHQYALDQERNSLSAWGPGNLYPPAYEPDQRAKPEEPKAAPAAPEEPARLGSTPSVIYLPAAAPSSSAASDSVGAAAASPADPGR